jgi:hypothetical protein
LRQTREKWQQLEEVGKQLKALIDNGRAPVVLKNGHIGHGLNHTLAKAGVGFITERFAAAADCN